jgi:alkylation response protein AidB-like acyl-CoA dehydrogenase
MNTVSIVYANQREQFKKPISSFGAIQYKLAEQAIRIFVVESALYRTSSDIENMKVELLEEGKKYADALMGAAEEYAIECAILKVAGSEMVDYVVDEKQCKFMEVLVSPKNICLHVPYRDARINRIFGRYERNQSTPFHRYAIEKSNEGPPGSHGSGDGYSERADVSSRFFRKRGRGLRFGKESHR